MTKIPDENFPTPAEINEHPCVTADRYLNAVEETVIISQVCQDVYNTSLVILNISLVGAYLFSPTLKILSVDGDTSYEAQNITATFVPTHFRNPELPINTNCSVWHGELVFDFSNAINTFLSAEVITFRLEMAGQVPAAYNVSFPPQTASTTYVWEKGVLPSPVNLTYLNGNLGVTFEYLGNENCSCNLTCNTATGVTQNIVFCPNETQTVVIAQDASSQDPYSVLIQLSDTLGNISTLEFQTVFNAKPKSPIISKGSKPKRVEVAIAKESINNVSAEEGVQYQVLKYEGSPNNYRIWKDWSQHDWNNFVDYDVLPYHKYGYAVRFKGQFGDESQVSDWAEVTI